MGPVDFTGDEPAEAPPGQVHRSSRGGVPCGDGMHEDHGQQHRRRAQRREIAGMEWLIDDIGHNGTATTDEQADERPVPEFGPVG